MKQNKTKKVKFNRKYIPHLFFILFVLFYTGARMLFTQEKLHESPQNVQAHLTQTIDHFYDNPSQYIHYTLDKDSIASWNTNYFASQDINLIIETNKPVIKVNDIIFLTSIIQSDSVHKEIYAIPLMTGTGNLLQYRSESILPDNTFRQHVELQDNPSEYIIPIANEQKIYLNYADVKDVPFSPSLSVMLMATMSLILFVWFVISITHRAYSRYDKVYVWLGIAFATILIIKFNQVLIPTPFNLDTTLLFSSELFSSVGAVNTFAICILSVIILTLITFSFNIYIKKKELLHSKHSVIIKLIAILVQTYLFFHFFLPFIFNLIRDSRLSFEFYDLNRINIYSFLALFIISLCLLAMTICVNNIKRILDSIQISVILKWIILFSIVVLNLLSYTESLNYEISTLLTFGLIYVSLLVLTYIIPFPFDQETENIFSIFTIKGFVWYLLVGSICSIFIFQFSSTKEQNLRKELANSFFLNNNMKNEFKFTSDVEDLLLQEDNMDRFRAKVKNLATKSFQKFDLSDLKIMSRAEVLHQPFFKDWLDSISHYQESYQGKLSLEDKKYELLMPLIRNDSNVGYLYITYSVPADVISRILNTFHENQFANNYSVALYYKNHLISYSGKEYANLQLDNQNDTAAFFNTYNYSLYKKSEPDGQIVIVRYENNVYFSYISILSYSLILVLLNTFLLVLLHRLWNYRKRNKEQLLPFRYKLNFGVVLIVFFTFFVFASITTIFIFSNSKSKSTLEVNRKKLETIQAINKTMASINENDDPNDIYPLLKAILVRPNSDLIQTLFYYPNGYAASLNANFKLINPGIFEIFENSKVKNTQATVNYLAEIEDMNYYSIFKNSNFLGFFAINNNENTHNFGNFINDAISVLINLYIFLLLLSILLSIFIAQRLTASFELLTEQFRNMKLSGNKLIQYNKKDDLTLIVKEYNSMIQHVEAMAINLANSERESAWRDAAKQVAHEINNPITPIKLNIQYLTKEADKGKDISTLFLKVSPSILEQIDQLSEIAKSFSDFAMMPEPKNENVNLTEIIGLVVNIFKLNQGLKISFIAPDATVNAYTDPKFINIIYFNLIKNAIHAVKDVPDALIEIEIKPQDLDAVISISDNGIGIPPENLDKIFLPTFTTKSSGTGIGLNTTKSMILSLGGSIQVKSIVNKGTTFITKIPILM